MYMCVCTCVFKRRCVCMCVFIYRCVCTCILIHTCVCMCVFICRYVFIHMYLYMYTCANMCHHSTHMGRIWLVGPIKLYVSYAKEPYKRDDILQKRPIILSFLLTVATPYCTSSVLVSLHNVSQKTPKKALFSQKNPIRPL